MTHWKKLTNPNYLGAYSIEDGRDLILTIGTVGNETVVGVDGKKEECTVCHFVERGVKPMILNATNMKMITKLLKTPYIEQWSGHKIQIGVEKVKAFGEIVEALRVKSKLPTVSDPIKCSDCKEVITVAYNTAPEQVAAYTEKNYGRKLCAACAAKAKAAKEAEKEQSNDINK